MAEGEELFLVPPFHVELVRGVSSYALELFRTHPDLDTVYVADRLRLGHLQRHHGA